MLSSTAIRRSLAWLVAPSSAEAYDTTAQHLAHLRRRLVALDAQFGLDGAIFHLTAAEVAALSPKTMGALRRLAETRRDLQKAQLAQPAETGTYSALQQSHASHLTDMRSRGRGTMISGHVAVRGRAYLATEEAAFMGAPLHGFRNGDVLVAPSLHPLWFPSIRRAAGVIVDGLTSEAAAVQFARNHRIAVIVGIPNLGQFRPSDQLILHADGRVTAEADIASSRFGRTGA